MFWAGDFYRLGLRLGVLFHCDHLCLLSCVGLNYSESGEREFMPTPRKRGRRLGHHRPGLTIEASSRCTRPRRSGPERKLAQYAMERDKQWWHGRTPDQISARLPNIRGVADHTFPGEQFHARSWPNNAIT